MSKQQELKPVLKNIDELMEVTGVTLIHHFNKAVEIDRMQGALELYIYFYLKQMFRI